MRILFWGTPDFALPTLDALQESGCDVAAAVTRPDRPSGRGRRMKASAVKRRAAELGIGALTPERPRGSEFEAAIRALEPDLSVVVAYGGLLPRSVLDIPARGSINLHPSLLPELRGAAPIPRAIMAGRKATGVTVMRMVEDLDAGPIIAQRETPIGPRDTASALSRRLARAGAELMAETAARMERGPVAETEQDHAAATFAPKVGRASARVDWTLEPPALENLIRAMDEAPGAWTLLRGSPVKLFAPRAAGAAEAAALGGRPGEVVAADPERGLVVATAAGALRIGEVQPAGKRRMIAAAWLRGNGPRVGDRFE